MMALVAPPAGKTTNLHAAIIIHDSCVYKHPVMCCICIHVYMYKCIDVYNMCMHIRIYSTLATNQHYYA